MCRIIVDVDVFQRRFEAKMISAEKCFFLIFNAKESTFCFALLSSLSLGRSTLLQHIDPSKPCCCLEGHNTLSLSLSNSPFSHSFSFSFRSLSCYFLLLNSISHSFCPQSHMPFSSKSLSLSFTSNSSLLLFFLSLIITILSF